jgi:hypothetical protein
VTMEVVLEVGSKRSFARAVDWPGWCRPGKGSDEALAVLAAYGGRYAAALEDRVVFTAPSDEGAFEVVERVDGNATTDFGAPDGVFASDARPIAKDELARLRAVLESCWLVFDEAVDASRGLELRKGPRGGGRELDAIVGHVVGAETGYARRMVIKPPFDEDDPWSSRHAEREAVLEGLDRAVNEGLPDAGPRGGKIWLPRRFLHRAAWHVLDHAWEIEDRARPETG